VPAEIVTVVAEKSGLLVILRSVVFVVFILVMADLPGLGFPSAFCGPFPLPTLVIYGTQCHTLNNNLRP
jgi:hypothetical protein